MRINIEGINLDAEAKYEIETALHGIVETIAEFINRGSDETFTFSTKRFHREIRIDLDGDRSLMIDDATLCTSCGDWERTGIVTKHEVEFNAPEFLCEECERDYEKRKARENQQELLRDQYAQLTYSYHIGA